MTVRQWINIACSINLLIFSACGSESQGAATTASDAANINGEWTLTIDTPRGVQHPVVSISESGGKLTGTYASFRGPLDISSVSVEGNTFSFPLQITVPIGTIEVTYEGTIDGDQMTGQVKNPRGAVPFSGVRTGS